jgi:Glutathione S-transferase, N-terminal domain
MIKLYGHKLSGNSYKIRLMLSLLKLESEWIEVDVMKGEHKSPAYLAKNPFGQLPLLVDGEIQLADAQAILVYLARQYGDEQLRHGWDIHVRFGLESPELYGLMYAESHSRKVTPAAQIALDGLAALIGRLAASGSLKVSQEEATFVAFSSASGAVLSTYFLPGVLHDPSYLVNIRESMISSITTESNGHDGGLIANAVTTLGGNLDHLEALSQNEQNLLHEWLNRILVSSRNPSFQHDQSCHID